jgi:hypothetical protein
MAVQGPGIAVSVWPPAANLALHDQKCDTGATGLVAFPAFPAIGIPYAPGIPHSPVRRQQKS